LKKAQAMVQKTSRKYVTSTVLIFSSFLSFLMDVMGGKITVNLKELHQNRKRRNVHTGKELGNIFATLSYLAL
jgi:hypothetical protein